MEKVVTILNPVDIIYINDCLKNSKNPYSPETLNIVAVGTLYPPKGFDTLILAFGIIAREFENCNLWVIGRDHENNEALLRRQAERLGVSNKVNFLGFKKNPYVYMKYADLFVLSSRREGLPNVLLEAKYLGCKAVGTNCVEVISTLLKPKFVSLVDDAENLASVMNKALTCDEPTFSSNDFNGDLIGFLERITVKSKPV
jgi:glycosyltransferase involved in cell wall biosynthesis